MRIILFLLTSLVFAETPESVLTHLTNANQIGFLNRLLQIGASNGSHQYTGEDLKNFLNSFQNLNSEEIKVRNELLKLKDFTIERNGSSLKVTFHLNEPITFRLDKVTYTLSDGASVEGEIYDKNTLDLQNKIESFANKIEQDGNLKPALKKSHVTSKEEFVEKMENAVMQGFSILNFQKFNEQFGISKIGLSVTPIQLGNYWLGENNNVSNVDYYVGSCGFTKCEINPRNQISASLLGKSEKLEAPITRASQSIQNTLGTRVNP